MSLISCFPSTDESNDSIPIRELTHEQYDALTEEEKQAAVLYILPDGESGGGSAAPAGGNIPPGGIIIWSGASDAVPDGWAVCDGENGTPDLRGRFVLGESASYAHGATGGAATVALTTAQMPSHSHTYSKYTQGKTDSAQRNTNAGQYQIYPLLSGSAATVSSGTAGSGAAHNNMPPYYVLCYIMKL